MNSTDARTQWIEAFSTRHVWLYPEAQLWIIHRDYESLADWLCPDHMGLLDKTAPMVDKWLKHNLRDVTDRPGTGPALRTFPDTWRPVVELDLSLLKTACDSAAIAVFGDRSQCGERTRIPPADLSRLSWREPDGRLVVGPVAPPAPSLYFDPLSHLESLERPGPARWFDIAFSREDVLRAFAPGPGDAWRIKPGEAQKQWVQREAVRREAVRRWSVSGEQASTKSAARMLAAMARDSGKADWAAATLETVIRRQDLVFANLCEHYSPA